MVSQVFLMENKNLSFLLASLIILYKIVEKQRPKSANGREEQLSSLMRLPEQYFELVSLLREASRNFQFIFY